MDDYSPPFYITNKMLEYVSEIMYKIGKIEEYALKKPIPLMRYYSIYSSLAIEANPLSFYEVEDLLSGKTVDGSEKDIKEVLNASKAYNMMKEVKPSSVRDLKKVHGVMTKEVVEESGVFRKCDEGVFDSKGNCIHLCPPPYQVDYLIKQLFDWMKKNYKEVHPLILSSVFHYEFVFIHPFTDGNGRMARLWQNIILSNWKELFEYLPIEKAILEHQQEYYEAIRISNKNSSANEFIEFMLRMIKDTIDYSY